MKPSGDLDDSFICLSFPFVDDTNQNSVVLQPVFVQFSYKYTMCSFKDISCLWIHELPWIHQHVQNP